MGKTQFLDLPNDLLLFIFEYLTAIELISGFFGPQIPRIEALIKSFTSFVDISEENDLWLETFLSDALTQRRIDSIRLNDNQIPFVSKYLPSSGIQWWFIRR